MKIAIDGPAGAGKSTVARKLAQMLGIIYIDTGAMYRALAWQAIQQGIDPQDPDKLYGLTKTIEIHFHLNSDKQRIICNNKDITDYIRSPEVNAIVSQIAGYPEIRGIMVKKQQEMAKASSIVMDGRDIGECVLPEADFKFYLTADIDERVSRRIKELKSQGYDTDFQSVKKEIAQRDINDSTRDTGRLRILADSIVIDTTSINTEQVLKQLLSIIRED